MGNGSVIDYIGDTGCQDAYRYQQLIAFEGIHACVWHHIVNRTNEEVNFNSVWAWVIREYDRNPLFSASIKDNDKW